MSADFFIKSRCLFLEYVPTFRQVFFQYNLKVNAKNLTIYRKSMCTKHLFTARLCQTRTQNVPDISPWNKADTNLPLSVKIKTDTSYPQNQTDTQILDICPLPVGDLWGQNKTDIQKVHFYVLWTLDGININEMSFLSVLVLYTLESWEIDTYTEDLQSLLAIPNTRKIQYQTI